MVRLASVATLLLILAGCGDTFQSPLPTPDTVPVQSTLNFPTVVRVISIGQLCSGIFVSPRAMLTASHCVRQNSPVMIQNAYGRYDSSLVIKNGPGTAGDSKDIALVVLPQPVVEPQALYPVGQTSVGETVHVVGFGCTNAMNHAGSGVKREGTNVLYRISQYLEVLSPVRAPGPQADALGILGPVNRAGSCFGDSGGPMLKEVGQSYTIVGIDHAVIPENGQQISAYINLFSRENIEFLRGVNSQYQLSILGL